MTGKKEKATAVNVTNPYIKTNSKEYDNNTSIELSSTRTERIVKHRQDMPKQYRKLYDRVMAGEASPREAIKMQCLECYGYTRTETQKCINYLCCLYHHRPYKSVKLPREGLEQARIDKYGSGGS